MTLQVAKTVKMYVGGAFIRSESGATTPFMNKDGSEYARVCVASRKDFRNTVEKAKAGEKAWSGCTAYLKSQIMYRMAEMTQGKFDEFKTLFKDTLGLNDAAATKEVQAGIDTFVYYAGWCDKYQQAMGAVNPVAAPYHNFTTPEQMGVVVLVDSNKFSFAKLVDNICSILVGGNSVIALVSPECAPIVTQLGEVMATSDLPAGAVNLLCGDINSLKSHVATHMEVKGISFQNENEDIYTEIRKASIDNMKRIIPFKKDKSKSLDLILDFVEQKTVWHPIGY
jgi:acyl-CoA reductase-like NAD-dependent aldehyde dehydrogenase